LIFVISELFCIQFSVLGFSPMVVRPATRPVLSSLRSSEQIPSIPPFKPVDSTINGLFCAQIEVKQAFLPVDTAESAPPSSALLPVRSRVSPSSQPPKNALQTHLPFDSAPQSRNFTALSLTKNRK
jgi:hypothetical protein